MWSSTARVHPSVAQVLVQFFGGWPRRGHALSLELRCGILLPSVRALGVGMMRRVRPRLSLLALVALACSPLASAQEPSRILYLIVDSSGSMAAPIGDSRRIDAAANIVREELLRADGRELALRRVGGSEGARCEATDVLAPIGSGAADVTAGIAGLTPSGSTPIALALERAIEEIGDRPAEIVLITDGNDTCNRNVCEVAARWRAEERQTIVRVRGVGIAPQIEDEMGCLSVGPISNRQPTIQVVPPPSVSADVNPRTLTSVLMSVLALFALLAAMMAIVDRSIAIKRLGDADDVTVKKTPRLKQLAARRNRATGVFVGALFTSIAALGLVWFNSDIAELLRAWWWFANTDFGSSLLPAVMVGFVSWLALQLWENYSEETTEDRNRQQRQSAGSDSDPDFEEPAMEEISPAGPTPSLGSANRFEEIRAGVRAVKDRLEERIAGLDGRRLRKYARTPRYDYSLVVEMLKQDGDEWTVSHHADLTQLFDRWKPHRTGRLPVRSGDLGKLEALIRRLLND